MVKPSPRPLHESIKRALNPIIYSSIAALSLTSVPVFAQDVDEDTEEVVVTGSRIRTDGMESPSPVTVVTLEEIQLTDPTSIIEGLADLPQFRGSYAQSGWSSGVFNSFFESPGAGTLALRGLQGKRTLALLDGRRVTPSSLFAGADVNMFPLALLSTVESITGGATAVYGTDAVAGAVNFIINKNFQGFNGSVRTGFAENGPDGKSYGVDLSGGFALGEKTNILLSYRTSEQDMIVTREDFDEFDWYNGTRYVESNEPFAGESPQNPVLVPRDNVVSTQSTFNGVIYFPQNTDNGRWAVQDDGSARPFQYSDYVSGDGNLQSVTNCEPGECDGVVTDYYSYTMMPENSSDNYYMNLNHDLTDDLNIYTEVLFGQTHNKRLYPSIVNLTGSEEVQLNQPPQFPWQAPDADPFAAPGYSPFAFYGNPFIPAEVQQLMEEQGMDYIRVRKEPHPDDLLNSYVEQNTDTLSVTVGADWEVSSDGFFDGWRVKAYYTSGHTDAEYFQNGGLRQDRFYQAVDAVVVDPVSGDQLFPGDPGFDTGDIVCNVSRFLDAPENQGFNYENCVPYNIFGAGGASPEAIDWVSDYEAGIPTYANGYFVNEYNEYDPMYYEYISREGKGRVLDLNQKLYEISADGQIHEGFGAGPISMAMGYHHREESFVQNVVSAGTNPSNDPNIQPAGTNNHDIGRRGISEAVYPSFQDSFFSNVPFARGATEVDEAFVELRLPLLADLPGVQQFNFGGSARFADYKDVDQVWSWKGGIDWRVNDELRFRGTVSQDVRAPSMAERYDRTGSAGSITDYGENPNATAFGRNDYTVLTSSYGSIDLVPEEAKTMTAGLVYQPNWLEGFQYSMDWYFIKVTKAINRAGPSTVVENCHIEEIEYYCGLIVREGSLSLDEEAPEGLRRISFIYDPYINQEYTAARGVDFEMSYRTSVNFFGGGETVSVRVLGSYLAAQTNNPDGTSESDWTGVFWQPWEFNVSSTYSRGPLSASLQARYRGGDTIDQTSRNQPLVADNGNPFLGGDLESGAGDLDDDPTTGVPYTAADGTEYGNELQEGDILWNVMDNYSHPDITLDGAVRYNWQLRNGASLNLSLNVNNVLNKSPRPNYGSSNGASGDIRGRRYSVSLGFNF